MALVQSRKLKKKHYKDWNSKKSSNYEFSLKLLLRINNILKRISNPKQQSNLNCKFGEFDFNLIDFEEACKLYIAASMLFVFSVIKHFKNIL